MNIIISCNNNRPAQHKGANSFAIDTLVDKKRSTTKATAYTIESDKSLASKTDWLLVPGVSAVQTKIGEDADSVYQRLRTPDGGDAAMQRAVAI